MLLIATLLGAIIPNSLAHAQDPPRNPPSKAARNRVTTEKLKQKINLDFQSAPLEDVLRFVTNASMGPGPDDPGIKFEPARKDFERLGVTMTARVTVRSEGKPLEASLREMLRPLKLDYAVEDGAVKIRAGAEKDKREDGKR